MASADTSREDRHLPASERRLQKAADDGQTARSRDLGHSALFGGFMLGSIWFGSKLFEQMIQQMGQSLSMKGELLRDSSLLSEHVVTLAGNALANVTPLLVLLALATIVVAVIPGGFVLSTKPITPDFSRASPARGLQRLFNRDILIDMTKLVMFASLLAIAGGWYSWAAIPTIAQISAVELSQAINLSFLTIQKGLWWLLAVMLTVALIDVFLQTFRHQSNLKMTLQEVRDEMKETDGDPQMKGRIRARQQTISRARMLADVPHANVIITNPSHFAVAVCYDENGMGAPTVVAKGADHMAAKIREIAGFCEIPFVEAPPLARALYKHVEVGKEIPSVLYQAVAQVLAYVYQLQNWQAGRAARPTPLNGIDVPPELDPNNEPQGMRR